MALFGFVPTALRDASEQPDLAFVRGLDHPETLDGVFDTAGEARRAQGAFVDKVLGAQLQQSFAQKPVAEAAGAVVEVLANSAVVDKADSKKPAKKK